MTALSLDPRPADAPIADPVTGAVRAGWTALVVSTVARTLLVVALGLVVWTQLPALVGWQSTVVMSGSMSPHLRTGDIAVVRPIDPTSVRVGQVLLVQDPDDPSRLRLHRLVTVEDGGLRLQGDANPTPDSSLVDPQDLRGIGVLRVPGVGLPVVWAAGGQWLLLAAAGAGLVALVAAAGWSRAPGPSEDDLPAAPATARRPLAPPAGRPGSLPPGPWARRSGRHRRRRTLWITGTAVGAVLVAVSTVLVLTTALAGYAAATVNSPNSWGMSETARWGCVDQSAAHAGQFYALTEQTGTTAYNTGTSGSAGHGTYQGGVLLDQDGPACGFGPVRAVTLDGSTGWISTAVTEPTPDDFTTQVWFRTSVRGGKLFQLNGQQTTSAQYDRHVYMTGDGRLVFGVYSHGYKTVTSPTGKDYADGVWHLATASLSSAGMHLYVDGVEVAANAAYTVGENMANGYWWFGTGQLSGWPDAPPNGSFTGSLASAAVWDHALTAAQVAAQYRPQT